MPRAFDSDEVAQSDGPMMLHFTEYVDCPSCQYEFEGEFHDDSLSVEDMTDPPYGEHTCPQCKHRFASEATGWSFFSEAG